VSAYSAPTPPCSECRARGLPFVSRGGNRLCDATCWSLDKGHTARRRFTRPRRPSAKEASRCGRRGCVHTWDELATIADSWTSSRRGLVDAVVRAVRASWLLVPPARCWHDCGVPRPTAGRSMPRLSVSWTNPDRTLDALHRGVAPRGERRRRGNAVGLASTPSWLASARSVAPRARARAVVRRGHPRSRSWFC
jgi:hypothetical protein